VSADLVSAALRIASFVLLFQAAGLALFCALFAPQLSRSLGQIRRAGRISALGALPAVIAHHAIEAVRLVGDWTAILDWQWQSFVLFSSSGAALGLRIAGLIGLSIGTVLGLVAGFFRGAADAVIRTVAEAHRPDPYAVFGHWRAALGDRLGEPHDGRSESDDVV
jgi:hypothetical protein